MKQGLIEKIKSRGYWRINFQPLTKDERLDTLQFCQDIVKKNSINLRGWDFPHIPQRQDEDGSIIRLDNYVEAWEDWSCYKEFWRIYKSGQFLVYRGLREDWFEEHVWNPEWAIKISKGKYLGLLFSVIYEITEAHLFLSRLAHDGLYKEGVLINISLHNIKDRELWVDDNNRSSFFVKRKAHVQDLSYSSEYNYETVLNNSKILAQKIILNVFDSFGWNPTSDLISSDQDALLSGKIL